MFKVFLHALLVAHGVFLAVSAVGFFVFWRSARFWLPGYAHVLAFIGLLVGIWIASSVPANAPVSKEGPAAKFLLALAVPAIVYFFFVFYGGQRAAFRRRFERLTQCPSCKLEVTVIQGPEGRIPEHQMCPHCGQPLP